MKKKLFFIFIFIFSIFSQEKKPLKEKDFIISKEGFYLSLSYGVFSETTTFEKEEENKEGLGSIFSAGYRFRIAEKASLGLEFTTVNAKYDEGEYPKFKPSISTKILGFRLDFFSLEGYSFFLKWGLYEDFKIGKRQNPDSNNEDFLSGKLGLERRGFAGIGVTIWSNDNIGFSFQLSEFEADYPDEDDKTFQLLIASFGLELNF